MFYGEIIKECFSSMYIKERKLILAIRPLLLTDLILSYHTRLTK